MRWWPITSIRRVYRYGGDESYETIEAFTGHCTGLDIHEDMVWSPDPLYVVALDEVEIRQSDVALPLNWKPEAVVNHYSFDIKVEGWDRISSIICHVDGLNGSYFIGNRACHFERGTYMCGYKA